jgi:hypothetical protein
MAKTEEIKVEISPVFTNNDVLTLQPLKDGKETGTAFDIQGKSFNRSFKAFTAKPAGTQETAKAKFVVKKKSDLK